MATVRALRMTGLRPAQIRTPDTRRPDFAEECRRQCRLAAQADRKDTALQQFMDEALAAVDGLRKPARMMIDKAMTVKRGKAGAAFGRISREAMVEARNDAGRPGYWKG